MEAFVEAPTATERTPAKAYHFPHVPVLIFVVFEDRRSRRFSSGARCRVFIFAFVDRNDDVGEKMMRRLRFPNSKLPTVGGCFV